jgi:hypothetical protein
MRLILSGGRLYNQAADIFMEPSENVSKVFQNEVRIQHLMGLNQGNPKIYPSLRLDHVPEKRKKYAPSILLEADPKKKFRQVNYIQINEHEVVDEDMFVLVRISEIPAPPFI